MNLTSEETKVGQDNYHEALGVMDKSNYTDPRGVSRRDFLKGVVAAGAVSGAGLGAMYFGYSKVADPVRVGVIGTGDEGNVLIGAMNPEYVQVVAIADIRPYNIHRAFHGDWASPVALEARPGLMAKYGWKTQAEAEKNVTVYRHDYRELLKDPNVEAVIIALPLHLHAQATVEAMLAGKHVLVEKLMGHNVAQCKVMGRVAAEQGLLLAVGHQRHYSILYDNAVNLIRWGVMGQLHAIQAQWHRGNLPGGDSWSQPLPGGEMPPNMTEKELRDPIAKRLAELKKILAAERDPKRVELYEHQLAQWEAWNSDREINPADFGYQDFTLSDGTKISAMAELCRWRLWSRTGGGLMAELGSHQLDAAGIFVSALRKDGKKAHPLSVHAVGGRYLFPSDREAEDHVCCMFEFPGPDYDPEFPVGYRDPINNLPDPQKGIPGYDEDPNKKVVVTYSTINGNGFGGYGETVMGTKGTMVIAREQEVMLYAGSDTSSNVTVTTAKGGPTMDTQASGSPAAAIAKAASVGTVSRGYTEEIEHWAWCIRNPAPENRPRCHPAVALGDAVIALTTNVALRQSSENRGGYIKFEDAWYDLDDDATPDGSVVADEYSQLVKKTV
ncbi:MAG: Gfo/Idh/MocA family oxidoreductase [Pirellulaceae bacterium]